MEADFGEMPGTELQWLWGFMRVRLLQDRDPGKGNGTCASVPARLSTECWGPLCHPGLQPPPDSGAQPVGGEGKAASGGEAAFLWPRCVLCNHSAKQDGVGGVILLFSLFF